VSILFVLLLGVSVLAGLPGANLARTSTPPTPSQGNPLNLAILWHMHQPLYKNVLTGLYEMPWVRDHAATEYLDHPEILMQHPEVNVTFNLVPSLIYQIEDYAAGAIDNHIQLARIDIASATQEQRRLMAQEFIRLAPWYYTRNTTDGRIVNPWYDVYEAFPRLNFLVGKVGTDPLSLNDTELQDLVTIYFLRQVSIPYAEGQYNISDRNDTILQLLHKGTGYTQADTETALAIQRTIMAGIVGIYKAAQDRGQAEIITTPFYHPIAPLLMNGTIASDDAEHNISKGVWSDDTRYQYQNASDFYAARFGHPSAGVWSSEQSVSPDIIPYAKDAGFNWTSSDEGVLWQSQVGGQTVGNSLVNQTRAYTVTVAGRTMDIVFRDTDISNQVSFTYGGMPTDQAVTDFMQRIQGFHDNLTDAQRADGLVTLAADGENWMFMAGYPNDGRDFLNQLYENLTAAQTAGWLKTWKIGDFLSQPGRVKVPLSTLHAGSWIDANFRTWSGEEEEQVAWARLTAARQAVVNFTQTTEGRSFVDPTSSPAVKRAWEAIFAAEGSDWFWWYGDDQSSGDDGKFDMMFKAHLITAYRTIGVTPPQDISAVWGANATPTQPGAVTENSPPPTIDGTATPDEWVNATGWTNTTTGDLMRLRGFYAFADASSLYLRIDLNGDATALRGTSGRDVDVYLSYAVRLAERDQEVNLNHYGVNFATKNGGFTFNWDAHYRLHIVFPQALSTGVTPWSLFTAHQGPMYLGDGGWTYISGKDDGVSVGSVIEVLLPLNSIGLGPGDIVRLVAVTSNGTQDVDILPSAAAGPGQIQVLIPTPGPPIAVFTDPIGDDVGDGDYTYPQSGDYHCSDGSHCEDKLYDLTGFNISDAPTSVTFAITFLDIGLNQWGGPNGFSYQIVDIYIDSDRVPGSGYRAMLTGPHAEVTADFAWETAIQAAGWSDQRTYVTRDPLVSQRLQSGLLVRRVPGTMKVEITVPKALLPSGDPKAWGYVVVSGSQDGFGFDYWRAVAAIAGTWACGGAGQPAKSILPGQAPRIFDAITDVSTDQSQALASYTNSTLAQVPGVIVEVKAPGIPTVDVSPATPWDKGQVVTVEWNATPNAETLRPIQSYDVSVFYSATDPVITPLVGTTLNTTTFTVTKELNITIRVTASDGFASSPPFVGVYEVTKSPPPPPVNHAPVLTNASVDPTQGDERTVFLFSVRYVDVDGNAPNVSIVMDGTPKAMAYVGGDNSTGAIFRLKMSLSAGEHTYKFRADDRQGTANSTVEILADGGHEFTLTVASSGGLPFTTVAIGAGIGVAVVVAVLAYVLLRGRKPPKAAPAEESPKEAAEEPETDKKEGE
jgi:alpha-amylase/alpha-mannosidase (GH57 family)